MNSKDFLGAGLKFPLQVDPTTGKLAMVAQEDDIAEAVDIILRTHQGERVMRPDFGTSVADYVFAPAVYSMKDAIAYDLREQLLLQEPRIENVDVACREQNGITGALLVEISYTVRSTNNRYNRVYPFFISEGAENERVSSG
jgi:phage baseplate assembly protein W